jgi:hypothetical protein
MNEMANPILKILTFKIILGMHQTFAGIFKKLQLILTGDLSKKLHEKLRFSSCKHKQSQKIFKLNLNTSLSFAVGKFFANASIQSKKDWKAFFDLKVFMLSSC